MVPIFMRFPEASILSAPPVYTVFAYRFLALSITCDPFIWSEEGIFTVPLIVVVIPALPIVIELALDVPIVICAAPPVSMLNAVAPAVVSEGVETEPEKDAVVPDIPPVRVSPAYVGEEEGLAFCANDNVIPPEPLSVTVI